MKQLQLIYDRTIETQDKIRTINSAIKQALEDDPILNSLKEEINGLKIKMNENRLKICQEYSKELDDLYTLKAEVKMDKENMTDEAIQLLLQDKLENIKRGKHEYKPVFSVKWKKVKPEE